MNPVVLVILWCVSGQPNLCAEDRTGYHFPSGIACILAAQQIEAQRADRYPGLVAHTQCGPPEKET
jgi:hypothetical protein